MYWFYISFVFTVLLRLFFVVKLNFSVTIKKSRDIRFETELYDIALKKKVNTKGKQNIINLKTEESKAEKGYNYSILERTVIHKIILPRICHSIPFCRLLDLSLEEATTFRFLNNFCLAGFRVDRWTRARSVIGCRTVVCAWQVHGCGPANHLDK